MDKLTSLGRLGIGVLVGSETDITDPKQVVFAAAAVVVTYGWSLLEKYLTKKKLLKLAGKF